MTDQNGLLLRVAISRNGTASVSVGGDVDGSNADEMCAVVMRASAQDAIRCVVVDLSEVNFLDARGISALIVCKRCLHELGLEFMVVGARDSPLRALTLTGALDLLSSSVDNVRTQES